MTSLLPDLPEWQQRWIDLMLSGQPVHWQASFGRSSGRHHADRTALLGALALGDGHVHVAARDGLWCVTGTGDQLATYGPLWERLREPQPQPPVRSIYDEVRRLPAAGT